MQFELSGSGDLRSSSAVTVATSSRSRVGFSMRGVLENSPGTAAASYPVTKIDGTPPLIQQAGEVGAPPAPQVDIHQRAIEFAGLHDVALLARTSERPDHIGTARSSRIFSSIAR